MSYKYASSKQIQNEIDSKGCFLGHGDGIEYIKKIKNNSVSLFYGSPPYPNAKRNYKTWTIENYISEISPFIEGIIPKLKKDGFIVINVKANRTRPKSKEESSERSLVIERLMIYMKDYFNLYCVDIEIWIKSNPVPTGLRVACQDAYEYNLWFSKSPKWKINIDNIRRIYKETTLKIYKDTKFYARGKSNNQYVSKDKEIFPHKLGALPINIFNQENEKLAKNLVLSKGQQEDIINENTNIVYGSVSSKSVEHQAVQPEYLPRKYILATTEPGDIVVDSWLGSGTTGIVALKEGRKFIGFEINKEFYDLAYESIINSLATKWRGNIYAWQIKIWN